MKCPVCQKEKMEKKKDIIEQDGIEFEAYKCSSCGEEIMNMKQLRVLSNKYGPRLKGEYNGVAKQSF